MKDTVKIIIDCTGKLTSDEKDLALVRAMEKQFNTGPIIGEAFELLIHMSRNLQARDLLLSAMGVDDDKKEKMFVEVMKLAEKYDDEILEKRKQKAENG